MPSDDAFPTDDHQMDRFDRAEMRRFSARQGVLAVLVCAILLALAAGPSIRRQGREDASGVGRAALLAVGDPADALSRLLPLRAGADAMTGWLSPSPSLHGLPGFSYTLAASTGLPPVTADQFSAAAIGAPAPARRPLHTLLVTGDSMSQPLDADLAAALEPRGVRVDRDPHIGTGISSTLLVDWEQLAAYQVRHDHPDAVVMFIGANDGYAMPGPGGASVNCCGASWAAIYADRVRQMMNTYRQAGVAHVYWLTLPTPRDPARARIARVVNAAVGVAAQLWADQVTVIDTVPIFTPHGYRDAMNIGGQPTIVRQSDGIHLNDAGSALAARDVLEFIARRYRLG